MIALTGMIAAACGQYTGPDENLRDLSGTWTWAESTGGIAGRQFTPASEHYTVQFTFEKGRLTVLRNDSIKATPTFVFAGDTIKYTPAINVFLFDMQIEQQLIRSTGADAIALADPCCDRYDHHFIRKR